MTIEEAEAEIARLNSKVERLQEVVDAGAKYIAAQEEANAAQAKLIQWYQEQRGEYAGRVN